MHGAAVIGSWLLSIIASAGASALLLVALGYLLRNLITARLSRAVAYEYDLRMEEVRTQNARVLEALREARTERESSRTVALAALGSHVSAIVDRRVAAIDILWSAFREIDKNVPFYVHALEMISYNENGIGPLLHKELKAAEFLKVAEGRLAAGQRVASVRPFLGERLYALFYAARAILGRATTTTIRSYQQGSLQPWYDEEGIEDLLRVALTPDELEVFRNRKGDKLTWLTRQLEVRLMAEVSNVLSGGASAEDTLGRAQRLLEAAATADSQMDTTSRAS